MSGKIMRLTVDFWPSDESQCVGVPLERYQFFGGTVEECDEMMAEKASQDSRFREVMIASLEESKPRHGMVATTGYKLVNADKVARATCRE